VRAGRKVVRARARAQLRGNIDAMVPFWCQIIASTT